MRAKITHFSVSRPMETVPNLSSPLGSSASVSRLFIRHPFASALLRFPMHAVSRTEPVQSQVDVGFLPRASVRRVCTASRLASRRRRARDKRGRKCIKIQSLFNVLWMRALHCFIHFSFRRVALSPAAPLSSSAENKCARAPIRSVYLVHVGLRRR